MAKILSLDGGGTWALIQVRTLRTIYGPDVSGHAILKDFDLVAATSGGALVLAGLALDFTLKDIEELFLDKTKREQIFVELPLADVKKRLGFGERYKTKAKLQGLKEIFGYGPNTRLDKLRENILAKFQRAPHFLITAFDYDRKRASFFRSDKTSKSSSNTATGEPALLVDAVHATTNAPVNYFDEPAKVGDARYWDGGITGNNNPVLAAVTEWLANQPAGSSEVPAVLSLGTGTVFLPQAQEGYTAEDNALLLDRSSSNLLEDIQVLATSILDDPPDASSYIAHIMLRQLPRPVRIGIRQRRAGRRALQSQMPQLSNARAQTVADLAQRSRLRQLAEEHRHKLIPATESLRPVFRTLFAHQPRKTRPVEQRKYLTEQAHLSQHRRGPPALVGCLIHTTVVTDQERPSIIRKSYFGQA